MMKCVLPGILFAFSAIEIGHPDDTPNAPPSLAEYSAEAIEGWVLHLSPKLTGELPRETARAMELLREQLAQINKAVPAEALAHLHRVPLWFSPRYPDGQPPRAEYHPNPQWLREHGRSPDLAKSVEFTNILIFAREVRRMPWFVLHELAHAYHDQVLGFDHPEVMAAYQEAVKDGRYDNVKRWTGTEEVHERAYALTDCKEYFAETTEAYFGRNDFQPFDRKELRDMDEGMFKLLERLWRVK